MPTDHGTNLCDDAATNTTGHGEVVLSVCASRPRNQLVRQCGLHAQKGTLYWFSGRCKATANIELLITTTDLAQSCSDIA